MEYMSIVSKTGQYDYHWPGKNAACFRAGQIDIKINQKETKMSKLNLINLAKDEISNEEAQKVKGGVICTCDTCSCTSWCTTPESPYNIMYRNDRDTVKQINEFWYPDK